MRSLLFDVDPGGRSLDVFTSRQVTWRKTSASSVCTRGAFVLFLGVELCTIVWSVCPHLSDLTIRRVPSSFAVARAESHLHNTTIMSSILKVIHVLFRVLFVLAALGRLALVGGRPIDRPRTVSPIFMASLSSENPISLSLDLGAMQATANFESGW